MHRRRSLLAFMLAHHLIVVLFVTTLILAATAYYGEQAIRELSQTMIRENLVAARLEMVQFFSPIERQLQMLCDLERAELLKTTETEKTNALLIPVMRQHSQITSFSSGDAQGNTYGLRRLSDGWQNREARPEAWGKRTRYRHYEDAKRCTDERWEEALEYVPAERPWFQEAVRFGSEDRVVWTEPYPLFTDRLPGISASLCCCKPGPGNARVMTFSVSLENISNYTAGMRPTPNGKVFVTTEDGKLIGLPADERTATGEQRLQKMLCTAEELGIAVVQDASRTLWVSRTPESALFPFASGGETWWAGARPFHLGPHRTAWVVVAVPEKDFLAQVRRQQWTVLLIAIAAMAAASLLAVHFSRKHSVAIKALVRQSERIEELDLAGQEKIESSIAEVDQLIHAQERMRVALDSFSRYVPAEVVRELLQRGEAAQIGGRIGTLTIMFSDIRDFTTIAEGLPPAELTAHMAEYFDGLLRILQDGRATVDKLIGDSIMTFWGAPGENQNHARHAVEACLRCHRFLEEFNRRCREKGRPPLETGFGLATGAVMVGNVGSPQRLSYTVLGDAVNLASRIQNLNKPYKTHILAAEALKSAAGPGFCWRWIERVSVKGKHQSVDVFELLGTEAEVPEDLKAYAARYEGALRLFVNRDFEGAEAAARDLAASRPEDLAASRLAEHARRFASRSPGADWKGTIRLDNK